MRVENQTETRVWEDLILCPETSTKNAVKEFHLRWLARCDQVIMRECRGTEWRCSWHVALLLLTGLIYIPACKQPSSQWGGGGGKDPLISFSYSTWNFPQLLLSYVFQTVCHPWVCPCRRRPSPLSYSAKTTCFYAYSFPFVLSMSDKNKDEMRSSLVDEI